MASEGVQDPPPGFREWVTVALGATVTFCFSFFFYGWAALQALFERDGVYLAMCPEEEPLCARRSSRMILLFSVDNSVTILTGTVAGILLDRYGPASISLAGGLLQACGLLLMGLAGGPDEPALVDGFLLAFVISAVGGTCLMLQSLKLAFIVAPKHFALIMTLSNCLVDSSSVIPLGLYRFHVAGMSRAGIFTGYALLCLVSSAFLAFSWCGRPGRRLHRTNMEELQSAKPGACAEHPRLHGLTLKQQLSTFEFAVAVTFMMTQVFRSNAFLGVIKDLLQQLGDGDMDNFYTQLLTLLLPASTLFIPLFNLCMSRGGFAITFLVVHLLGVAWNVCMLIPSLQLQSLGFAAFTNYRGLLFASIFTFVGHTFGNRTFGRINALMWLLAAGPSFLIWPCAEVSKMLNGDLMLMNWFMLILCVPCLLMTLFLAKHLRNYPSGDIWRKISEASPSAARSPRAAIGRGEAEALQDAGFVSF